MTDETDLLKEISRKLSQLIVLTKLSNSQLIAETKKEINKDPVSVALLNLADGSLTYSQIIEKVKVQTKASEPTVKRRIADLSEKGALYSTRKGKEVYYVNSGLYG
jgi:Fic family protein